MSPLASASQAQGRHSAHRSRGGGSESSTRRHLPGHASTFIHRHGFRNTFIPLYGATVLGLLVRGQSPWRSRSWPCAACLVAGSRRGAQRSRRSPSRGSPGSVRDRGRATSWYMWTGDLVMFLVAAAVVGSRLTSIRGHRPRCSADLVEPSHLRTRTLSGFRFSVDLGAFIGPILLAYALDTTRPAGAILLIVAMPAIAALIANLIAVPPLRDALEGKPIAPNLVDVPRGGSR